MILYVGRYEQSIYQTDIMLIIIVFRMKYLARNCGR